MHAVKCLQAQSVIYDYCTSVLQCNVQQWVETACYRRSVMIVSMVGGCRVLQSPVEGLSRLQETNSQWEGISISNGPRKKWIFKDISTNWQWHVFIFVWGRDEAERWSREKAERLFNALWKTVKRECLRRSNKGTQPSSSSRPVTEVI